jgi:glycosyltransferase involved in cell wall biosynthesis
MASFSADPPLTVILPARNAEATIGPAIASTLNQTYGNFELWVLENGSDDHTVEIARSFGDPRIKVFELGPVGFQGAIRFAMENSSSEWLARMDADDLMFPDRLELQMEVIRRNRDGLAFVGTAFAVLTPFGHMFERVSVSPSREVDTGLLSRGRVFANPSTVFRRRVALEVGLDEECALDDISLWFRMLTRGRGWEIAKPLHVYRLQPNSMSKSADFYRQARRAREKYAAETLSCWPSQFARSSVWSEIASLELLAGHGKGVRQAASYLARDGFVSAARLMRWRSYLGALGAMYYRWRDRRSYRHRPDWERGFAPLLVRPR